MNAIGLWFLLFGAFLFGAGVERGLSSLAAFLPAWFYMGFGFGMLMTGLGLLGKGGFFYLHGSTG